METLRPARKHPLEANGRREEPMPQKLLDEGGTVPWHTARAPTSLSLCRRRGSVLAQKEGVARSVHKQ
jgi:hypothetical protein